MTRSRDMMCVVARRLGPLRERVVFVGGATAELLITDRAAGAVRATDDIDLIVSAESRADYLSTLSSSLRTLGFRPDMREDAPMCRWVVDEVTVDVMPTDGLILGFTNRWYDEGMEHAMSYELEPGLRVRMLTAPYFVATKLEAFKGRGHGDYLASADIEDVIAIVDGRPELLDEVRDCSPALQQYLAFEVALLLEAEAFADALEGFFRVDATARKRTVHARLVQLSRL